MKLSQTMRRLGWWAFALIFIWMFVGSAMLFAFLPSRETVEADTEAVKRFSEMLPTYVFIFAGGVTFFVLLSTGLSFGASIVNAVNDRSIRARGSSAEAIILKISETGLSINDNPVVKLLLDVGPPGQPRFQAEAERLISRLDIPQFQPGKTVQVKYDPDSKAVAIADRT
jgi:hypothetical protein